MTWLDKRGYLKEYIDKERNRNNRDISEKRSRKCYKNRIFSNTKLYEELRLGCDNTNNTDKRDIIIIGENEPGDQLLLARLQPLVEAKWPDRNITWVCDPRLVDFCNNALPQDSKSKFIDFASLSSLKQGSYIFSWKLVGKFMSDLFKSPDLLRFSPIDPEKNAFIDKYKSSGKKIIGLAWSSSRKTDTKSCPLKDPAWSDFFTRLKDTAKFVSLQYGDTTDDINFIRWKYGVEIYQDQDIDLETATFTELAAQIGAMDTIVSISTTTAHIAGAMGKSCHILLNEVSYPHWKAGTGKNIFYPEICRHFIDKKNSLSDELHKIANEISPEEN